MTIYNFAAGPATLPAAVLEEAQRDLVSLPGVGMSLLEMSHRSKPVVEMIDNAEQDIRKLAGIPDNYRILFLQGGASLQFSMVPMNLLSPDGRADHIVTGNFANLALKDARKVGDIRLAGSTEDSNHDRIPSQNELDLDPKADYVHFTGNNTIYGTEWPTEPDVGDVPLVLAVGSERGWTSAERDRLRAAGYRLVGMGSRVLRTETAVIGALAVIKAATGAWDSGPTPDTRQQ